MRITVHLDTFASTNPAAYAILWIDTVERRWSREGHAGVDLPEWGNVVCRDGATRVTGADDAHSLCVLEGLDLGAKQGPFEGETGAARWYRTRIARLSSASGTFSASTKPSRPPNTSCSRGARRPERTAPRRRREARSTCVEARMPGAREAYRAFGETGRLERPARLPGWRMR